jgi:pseudouridine-5'-phosphate glycosidase
MLVAPEVVHALRNRGPVVALESAVITHGLPYPRNMQVARDMEAAVRHGGAVPATIAVLDGLIRVGLSDAELGRLAQARSTIKVSRRDLAAAIVKKASGGTTVSATMVVAASQGIRIFATGGIGGVHREWPLDVSADLSTLGDTAVIVVCAGAKAILDLRATLEYLETAGVPVIGFKTDEFPAFYSRESGLKVSTRLDSPEAIAEFWQAQRELLQSKGLLVANPIPEISSIPRSEMEPVIERASREAQDQEIRGQELTPFLLARVAEFSAGTSIRANEALLLNNARLAAQIAKAVAAHDERK